MAVELWTALLDRSLTEREEEALLRLMPMERLRRLQSVQEHSRWREPLCAYAMLRQALWERYRLRKLPSISCSAMGKPFFPDYPAIHFNLSHTVGAVLVGVGDEPMGVDIEKIRPVSERAMLRLAGVATEREFFRSWVRLETRAKRDGTGVGTMDKTDLALRPGEFYQELKTFEDYVAGIAVRGAMPDVQLHHYVLVEEQ
jgi:4'-phosphopantetheinyl transferase